MKGDISRQTFDRKKQYSQVIMQQGRVQLDADWNEQQDILQYRIATQTTDIIGANGVPQHRGGFEVTFMPDNRDLLISPGRIYVDGTLCELDEGTLVYIHGSYEDDKVEVKNEEVDGHQWKRGQWVELLDKDHTHAGYAQIAKVTAIDKTDRLSLAFYADGPDPDGDVLEKVGIRTVRRVVTYLTQPNYPDPAYKCSSPGLPELDLPQDMLLRTYLDVCPRHITDLDDSSIREVALGGSDTSTRIQTLWQVKIEPATFPSDPQDQTELQGLINEGAEISKQQADQAKELEKLLQAQGSNMPTHDEIRRIKAIRDKKASLEYEFQKIKRILINKIDSCQKGWELSTGKLNVMVENTGYCGSQNELYRVEIHQGTNDTHSLLFKWARNNASTVAKVKMNDREGIVQSSGRGGILNFEVGQFVEAVNPQAELSGQPGNLVQILKVDTLKKQLDFDAGLGNNGELVTIRLWDGVVKNVDLDTWVPLTHGIKVEFSHGTYQSGDYWLLPARTSTKEVEWPPFPQLRKGVEHHYSQLAYVQHKGWGRGYPGVAYDCRKRFVALSHTMDAMHVIKMNWENDKINDRDLLKKGLEIHLDAEPDDQCSAAKAKDRYEVQMAEDSVIVTVELHMSGGLGEATFGLGKLEGIYILDGVCWIDRNIIHWQWDWQNKEGLPARLFKMMDNHHVGNKIFTSSRDFIRVRIRVKGNTIWHRSNNSLIYLDGQTFGVPGEKSGCYRPRIQLQLPSGAGAKASDFESWFYILE